MSEYLLLLGLVVLSYLGHNMSVFYAALMLLVMRAVLPLTALSYVGEHGVNWGITILTMALLVPVATGTTGWQEIIGVFKSPLGLTTLAFGMLVAALGGMGVVYMKTDPQVVVSLMIGTILGVFFFKGVPVGPLIASGMVYSFLKLMEWMAELFK